MTRLQDYFSHIFCINLDRRTDRWDHALDQFRLLGLQNVIRFSGHADVIHNGRVNGNAGCTASHRALCEIIAFNKWPRVLILEDDFECIHEDTQQRFSDMIGEVPNDWDMLYLGGHYADAPQKRISPHVIKFNRMLTTSSYGITWQMARRIAPYLHSDFPIDSLYSGFTPHHNCYIFQPRLFIQAPSHSDLTETHSMNGPCMLDPNHENLV